MISLVQLSFVFFFYVCLLRGSLTVKSSLLAAIADEPCDHGVAGAPLEFVHEFARRTCSTLTTRPDLDGSSAADYGVQREREHDLGLVVHFALDLPLADVLIASLACILHQNELAVRRNFLYADRALMFWQKRQTRFAKFSITPAKLI